MIDPTTGIASPDERAFYVDFEGPQDGPPVALGVLRAIGGRLAFRQEVVDSTYEPAAEAKELPTRDLREAIDALAGEVADTGAPVFAWSRHEMDVFAEFGSAGAVSTLSVAYRNAIPIAKRWRSRFAADWKPLKPRVANRGRHTLDAYMKKMDYAVPTAFGPFLTGKRLRVVGNMLIARGNDYSRLTPTVKAQWTKLLKHNEYDCFGLRCVCLRVLGDLGRVEPS